MSGTPRRPRPVARCVRCLSVDDVSVDEILPRSHGGWDDPQNRRLVCAWCRAQRRRPAWKDAAPARALRSLLDVRELRDEIRAVLAAGACAAEAHFTEGERYDRGAYAEVLHGTAALLVGPWRKTTVEAFDEDEERLLDGKAGVEALRRAIDEVLPTAVHAAALAERRPGWRWLGARAPVAAQGRARPAGTPLRRPRQTAA